MPFALVGIVIGAIWGAIRARARSGSRADIAQWAIVHALAFGTLGFFVALVIYRVSV